MFSTAEQTLKSSLKALGKDFYIKYLQHAVFFQWSKLVGDRIAEQVKPALIEHKILYVRVESAAWRTEFQFQKADLLKKINDAAECNLLDDIQINNRLEIPSPPPKSDEPQFLTPDEIVAQDLPNITLTEEEIAEVERNAMSSSNERLRALMLDTSLARARLHKCRLKHGWHYCAKCKLLVPPNEILCDSCQRKEIEQLRRTIGEIIRDVPWSTYAEVRNELQLRMPHMIDWCRPETVSSIRASLVQSLARSIDTRDPSQVKQLVMIYRQVPPDQLSADAVRKTMRRLRFDLPGHVDDY